MRHIANALLIVGMLWAAQGQARDKTMDYRGMKFSTDPKQFVDQLLYLHGEIIDEGKMAQRNSQSPQVKELSETLVKSHQSFDERLKKYLKEQKLQAGTFKPSTEQERGTVALEKSTENKLKTLSGDAFDQAFLAAQVSDHDRLLLSVLAGQQMFSGQPLGVVLAEMQPELLKLREQAYQLLGQQAASLGTGGAGMGTGNEPQDDKK